MRIYLVRHGKAADDGYRFDEDRPLTPPGRVFMRQTASAWAKSDEKPPELWLTSPLVRAVQTCEICVQAFRLDGPVEVTRALFPEAPVSTAAELFDLPGVDSVAVVGHEPLLSALASHLLQKEFPRDFKKGSILALKRASPGAAARLHWYLEPAKDDKDAKFRDAL